MSCRSKDNSERIAQLAEDVGRGNAADTFLYRCIRSAGPPALHGRAEEQVRRKYSSKSSPI